jgi:hypothetical protein
MKNNPFATFLGTVRSPMSVAWSGAAQAKLAPARYAAFTLNEEERYFALDIVARVEFLAFAYDRLCELGTDTWPFRRKC